MEDIVREFVKLDQNDKNRILLYERILKTTCYRLPLNVIVKNEEESHEILRRVKSEWSDNEVKWRKLFQEQEEQTRCRATRTRSGSISYNDINTGEAVSCADYEIRYLTYAETCKKKINCTRTSEFQLPPLQKPTSIASLLLANSNIGWYPELMQIDIPELNSVRNLEEDKDNISYSMHTIEKTGNEFNICKGQNSHSKSAKENTNSEFESPISVVSDDFPIKRIKTNDENRNFP